MATIRNVIETLFVAKGAQATAAATENVTKAQTRLGQTSASAGRQFSSQASGLGGLVAAYAGAAATTFAVTQAFAALQKAAQFDQIIQGTNTFSSAFGSSATEVLGSIQKITRGQLSLVEASTAANLALSAGFNVSQLNALTDVATKASRALGRDLQDSFNRVVRGSAKLEPELLDELGIFTRIEPAVEKYAASVNKAASSLTNYERRQAFVNEVIDEGQRKFATIDTANATSAQSFSKLAATVTDVALQVGSVVAEVLAPLADFISGNLSASFGAFGLLATLIFSKLREVSGAALTSVTDGITRFSDKVGDFGRDNKAATAALDDLGITSTAFNKNLGQGLGPLKARRNELLNLSAAGKLNLQQTKELQTIVEGAKNSDIRSIAALKAKEQALIASGKDTANLTRQIDILNRSLAQNNGLLAKTNAALATQSTLARKAAVAVALFGRAVAFLGSFVGKLFRLFNILTLVYSIINLVGPAILKAFGLENIFNNGIKALGAIAKSIFGVTEAAKGFKVGLEGVAATLTETAFAAEGVQNNLEAILRKKVLGFTVEVEINAQTIQKSVSDAINKALSAQRTVEIAQNNVGSQYANRANEITRLEERQNNSGLSRLEESDLKRLQNLQKYNQAFLPLLNGQEAYTNEINKSIEKVRDLLQLQTDPAAIDLLNVELRALDAALKISGKRVQLGGELARVTGISSKLIQEQVQFSEEGVSTIVIGNKALSVQLETLNELKEAFNTNTKEGLESYLNAVNLQKANQGILATALNINKATSELFLATQGIETISRTQGELLAQEEALREKIAKLTGDDQVNAEAQLELLKQQRVVFNERANAQSRIINAQEQIRKSFSAQIAAADKLTGIIDAQGNIALDKNQISANELTILKQAAQAQNENLEVVKNLRSLSNEERAIELRKLGITEEQYGLESRRFDLQQTAQKAIAGAVLQTVQNARKLTIEYEKQTRALEAQEQKTRLGFRVQELQNQQKLAAAENRVAAAREASGLKELDRQRKTLELTQRRTELEAKIKEDSTNALLGGVAGGLFTENDRSAIEIRFRQEELDRLIKANDDLIINAALQREQQLDIANKDFANLEAKAALDKQLIDAQTLVQAADIGARREELKAKEALFRAESSAIQTQLDTFLKFPNEIAKILGGFTDNFSDLLESAGLIDANKANSLASERAAAQVSREATIKAQVEDVSKRFSTASNDYAAALKAQEVLLDDQKNQILQNADTQKKVIDSGVAAAAIELEDTRKNITEEYNAVVDDAIDKEKQLKATLQDLKDEAERANNTLLKVAVAFNESFGSNLESSMRSLVQAVNEGTLTIDNFKQGFKDFIINILQDVQNSLIQETLINPLKQGVSDILKGSFGFGKEKEEAQGKALESLATGLSKSNEGLADKLDSAFGNVQNVRIVAGQAGLAVQVTGSLGGAAGAAGGAVGGLAGAGTKFFDNFDTPSTGIVEKVFDEKDQFFADSEAGYEDSADAYLNFADKVDTSNQGMLGSLGSGLEDFGSKALGVFGGLGKGLSSVFEGVFDGIGSIISGIFGGAGGGGGGGGIFGSLLGGIGSLFGGGAGGGLFSGAGNFFTEAFTPSLAFGDLAMSGLLINSGGLVTSHGALGRLSSFNRFAAGGLQRDRIPALLEPGEFVLRKSAVDSMGVPAAEMLNATGRANAINNKPTKVMIENSGSDKEASDSTFDPESAVLKIVLKDLATNGPIRKSIRSNT